MEELSRWVLKNNPVERGMYTVSYIGFVSGFICLCFLTENPFSWANVILGFLVVVLAVSLARHSCDRYLFVSGEHMEDLSTVMSVHDFDVEGYFAILKRRMRLPALAIAVCTSVLGVICGCFGERCVAEQVATICVTGVCSEAGLWAYFSWKKREMSSAVSAQKNVLEEAGFKVVRALWSLLEFLEDLVFVTIVVMPLYGILQSVVQPPIDQSAIVRRNSAEIWGFWCAEGAMWTLLIVGFSRHYANTFKKVMLCISGVCAVGAIVMLVFNSRCYEEIEDWKFRVCRFGVREEYDLSEVERFRIYEVEDGIGFELVFEDGKAYEVCAASLMENSDRYDEMYYSDFNFVADYAGRLLEQGAEGTLEDEEQLSDVAETLHPKVQKGWAEIVEMMARQ